LNRIRYGGFRHSVRLLRQPDPRLRPGDGQRDHSARQALLRRLQNGSDPERLARRSRGAARRRSFDSAQDRSGARSPRRQAGAPRSVPSRREGTRGEVAASSAEGADAEARTETRRESPEPRPAARRPVAAPAKASSKAPILIAGAVVAVLAIVAAVVLTRGSSSPSGTTGGGKSGSGSGTGTSPTTNPADREAQARDAYAKVVELSGRAGTSWDHVLAAIEKAKPTCRGTAMEKRLEELRVRAAQEKEAEDAAKDLAPLVDELKGAVATDPEFKRFVELQPKFQLAIEMAAKSNSPKKDEIQALRRDYNGKYEKLAEPFYDEINEEATAAADEKRFDDALRKINTFPQHLRNSTRG
jgi:hypothetical protein